MGYLPYNLRAEFRLCRIRPSSFSFRPSRGFVGLPLELWSQFYVLKDVPPGEAPKDRPTLTAHEDLPEKTRDMASPTDK